MRFLVCINFEGEYFWSIKTSSDIFQRMDMADCTGEEIVHLSLLPDDGYLPIECVFHGVWHDFNDPLKMVIESGGQEVAVGYGTDH